MKKIDIHFFPSDTKKPRSFRISLLRPIWWIIGALVAVLGFLLFSPFQIFDTLANNHLLNLYRQNQKIEQAIEEVRFSIRESESQYEAATTLRDSSIKLSGLAPLTDKNNDSLIKHTSISHVHATLKRMLDSLENNSSKGLTLPIGVPVKIKPIITNKFGMIFDPFTERELPHRGIDFAATEGDTVYATGAGKIIEVRSHRGYGLSIKVEHSTEVRSFYAHLEKALVREGTQVKRNTPIALVGKSGRSTGPSLHYEIRLQGQSINPEPSLIGL